MEAGSEIQQRRVRTVAFDKKQDRHSGEEIADIQQHTFPRSDGAKAVEQLLLALEDPIRAAELGWYPAQELSDALLEFVRKRHTNGEVAKEAVKAMVQESYKPVYHAAVAKGWALVNASGMTTARAAGIAPPAQQGSAGSSTGGSSNQPPVGADASQTAMLTLKR